MNCNIAELWEEHKEALLGFINNKVMDDSTAKDIFQDVLLKVYRFCCCKSGVRNERAWLLQIAHNTIIDYYRKQKRHFSVADVHEIKEVSENSSFKEAAEFILPMIQLLPKHYADPLRMSDVQGIKLKEIALSMNLGLSAVKQRVVRGRKLLKDIFEECCLMELDNKGRMVSFDIRPGCISLQRYKESLKIV